MTNEKTRKNKRKRNKTRENERYFNLQAKKPSFYNSFTFFQGGIYLENKEPNFLTFNDTYIKMKQEETAIKRSGNFVGITFIILMVLPFVLSAMLTSLLRVFGLSSLDAARLISEPMFLMVTQTFLSVAMFILPLGVILYGEHFKLSELVSFKKPNKEHFLPSVLMCVGITAFANIVTNILTSLFNSFGIPVSAPDIETPKGILGFIVTFIAIAITPALVEELAMRGVVMGSLKRYGKGFAIGVSAIIFGMMHGNLSQLPFAFILGLAIGFAVIKTDSIWTGVIIHFINNAISVIIDALFSKTESTQVIAFINSLYFSLCILAFFVGLYLLKGKTKEFLELEEEPNQTKLSVRMKWFFSSPAMIIAIGVTVLECILALFMY